MPLPFYHLDNPIQNYAWGSRSAIPEILGLPSPADEPMAELWMGTHPKAPSTVRTPDGDVPLGRLIADSPEPILGAETVHRFGAELPYLFKILAAAAPLSIQAHPDAVQAASGFEDENRRGIPLDSPKRNYRDPNPKPECICALTPFWAMRGFRAPDAIRENLDRFCPREGERLIDALDTGRTASDSLRRFFENLMKADGDWKPRAIQEAVSSCRQHRADDAAAEWVVKLSDAYPGDVGVLSPLFLHTFRLEPGDAMFLPAGELHAYLEGVGIELMGNSDNVIRGGLTPKHVAVEELMRILTFGSERPEVLDPHPISETESEYPTPATQFKLSVIRVSGKTAHRSSRSRSVEILLVVNGTCRIESKSPGGEDELIKGDSVLIPAATAAYALKGNAVVYKASVPI
ncbi:MAG: mannose-6-phosphate isomerase, class I [Desulfobacterales bacterium]